MTLQALFAVREQSIRSRLLTLRNDLPERLPAGVKPEPVRAHEPSERKRAVDNPKNFCACGNFKRGRAQMCLECFHAPITCACGSKKPRTEAMCRACVLETNWMQTPLPRCGCGRVRAADRQRCSRCIAAGRYMRRSA
jgi:hypothetical protein